MRLADCRDTWREIGNGIEPRQVGARYTVIQSAEREFLVKALTDDDVDDGGVIDEDDIEFDEQLEIAGEITLCTGSASSDDKVVDFLANGCGCTKLTNGPCSQGLSAEDVSIVWLLVNLRIKNWIWLFWLNFMLE